MAAHVLLKLSLFTGSGSLWDEAQRNVSAVSAYLTRFPTSFSHWLSAASFILSDPQEVAVAGNLADPDTQALIAAVYDAYRPNLVIAAGENVKEIPLHGRQNKSQRPTCGLCLSPFCLPQTRHRIASLNPAAKLDLSTLICQRFFLCYTFCGSPPEMIP